MIRITSLLVFGVVLAVPTFAMAFDCGCGFDGGCDACRSTCCDPCPSDCCDPCCDPCPTDCCDPCCAPSVAICCDPCPTVCFDDCCAPRQRTRLRLRSSCREVTRCRLRRVKGVTGCKEWKKIPLKRKKRFELKREPVNSRGGHICRSNSCGCGCN